MKGTAGNGRERPAGSTPLPVTRGGAAPRQCSDSEGVDALLTVLRRRERALLRALARTADLRLLGLTEIDCRKEHLHGTVPIGAYSAGLEPFPPRTMDHGFSAAGELFPAVPPGASYW